MHSHCIGSSVCLRASFHLHVIHDERLTIRSLLLPRSVFLRVSLRRLPLLFHTWTLIRTPSSMWTAPRETLAAPSPNEEYRHLAIFHPPTRLLFPRKKRKRQHECCGYCENFTTIGLRLARLGSIGFSKRKTAREKLDAQSLGIDSKSSTHRVYVTSSKYLGKERTIEYKKKILISEVPTL